MPSNRKLTWQSRKDGTGRWKKIYRGQVYYFSGGTGKSDDQAYRKAVSDWERQKVVVDQDAEENKPHRVAYEKAIEDWQAVLAWGRENDDLATVTAASVKMGQLRKRLDSQSPTPIDRRQDLPLMQVGMAFGTATVPLLEEDQISLGSAMQLAENLDVPFIEDMERVHHVVSKFFTDKTWKNRIRREKRKAAEIDQEFWLQTVVAKFVDKRRAAGTTPGGVANLKRHLDFLVDHLGTSFDVREFNGSTIDQFHAHVLSTIEGKRFTRASARDLQATVRSFVRWLWEIEILSELPRNLAVKSHRIVVEAKSVKAFSIGDIHKLYDSATEYLKLFVLLALNCGMTQIDISDLRPDDVDWIAKTLSRKRGKTRQFDSVPIVTYPLWPESLALLKQFKSTDSDRLLLAPEGGPLKFEVNRNGKVAKNDFIGLKFRRMLMAIKLSGQFKMLKKTSASLLRNHPNYSGLEGLFLDHSPRSTSDKHYAQVPTTLLAEAVNWLRDQYRLQKPKRRQVKSRFS